MLLVGLRGCESLLPLLLALLSSNGKPPVLHQVNTPSHMTVKTVFCIAQQEPSRSHPKLNKD